MTEFEKYWEEHKQGDKAFAEKLWNAAQRACVRILEKPPVIPEVGDKVRLLSLCHPESLGVVKEVIGKSSEFISLHTIETKVKTDDGKILYSGGILGELEIVDKKP